MAGIRDEFPSTHWSLLQAAGEQSEAERNAALNQLILRYWKPVYVYICLKGLKADAADVTQDFFVQVLRRELFEKADQARGGFRIFLLTCLKRFVIDAHRRRQTRNEGAASVLIHDLVTKDQPVIEATTDETPEDTFQRTWVNELLARVWRDVQRQMCENGKEVHSELFRQRVYEPAMKATTPLALEDLAVRYGLSPKEASNRTVTVIRAFRKRLAAEIRQYASTEDEIQSELRDLFRFAADPDAAKRRHKDRGSFNSDKSER